MHLNLNAYSLTAVFFIGEYLWRQCVSGLLIADRCTFVGRFFLHEFFFRFFARFADVHHIVRNLFTVEYHQNSLLSLLDLQRSKKKTNKRKYISFHFLKKKNRTKIHFQPSIITVMLFINIKRISYRILPIGVPSTYD